MNVTAVRRSYGTDLRRGRSGDVEHVVGVGEGHGLRRLSPFDALEHDRHQLCRHDDVEGSSAVTPEARRRAGPVAGSGLRSLSGAALGHDQLENATGRGAEQTDEQDQEEPPHRVVYIIG